MIRATRVAVRAISTGPQLRPWLAISLGAVFVLTAGFFVFRFTFDDSPVSALFQSVLNAGVGVVASAVTLRRDGRL